MVIGSFWIINLSYRNTFISLSKIYPYVIRNRDSTRIFLHMLAYDQYLIQYWPYKPLKYDLVPLTLHSLVNNHYLQREILYIIPLVQKINKTVSFSEFVGCTIPDMYKKKFWIQNNWCLQTQLQPALHCHLTPA